MSYVNYSSNSNNNNNSTKTTCDKPVKHKLKASKQDIGNVMQATIEFTPDGDNQAIWESVKTILLNQYLERIKIGSMQREPQALYSSPLEGTIENLEENTNEEG